MNGQQQAQSSIQDYQNSLIGRVSASQLPNPQQQFAQQQLPQVWNQQTQQFSPTPNNPLQYFNPMNTDPNNFWRTPVAAGMTGAQNMMQAPFQAVGNLLSGNK